METDRKNKMELLKEKYEQALDIFVTQYIAICPDIMKTIHAVGTGQKQTLSEDEIKALNAFVKSNHELAILYEKLTGKDINVRVTDDRTPEQITKNINRVLASATKISRYAQSGLDPGPTERN